MQINGEAIETLCWRVGDIRPNMLLHKHAAKVASPVAACPAQTLLQKFRVVLKCGLHLTLRMILHVSLLAMRDHPASDKVIIIGIELVLPEPPLFVSEATGEGFILQYLCTICNSATRKTRHATINMGGCRTIKVPPFKIQSTQKAIDTLRERWAFCPS